MRLYLSIAAIVNLSACATPPATPVKTQPEINKGLSAQTLAPGECGLFIWTASPDRRFIIFSQAQKQTGIWNRESGDIILSVQIGNKNTLGVHGTKSK